MTNQPAASCCGSRTAAAAREGLARRWRPLEEGRSSSCCNRNNDDDTRRLQLIRFVFRKSLLFVLSLSSYVYLRTGNSLWTSLNVHIAKINDWRSTIRHQTCLTHPHHPRTASYPLGRLRPEWEIFISLSPFCILSRFLWSIRGTWMMMERGERESNIVVYFTIVVHPKSLQCGCLVSSLRCET